MFNILLIAGHGGNDPGACAFGKREADLARELVTLLQKEIMKYGCQCGVYNMSRSMYHDIIAEGYKYNFKPYDYVLEVHFNAFKVDNGDGKNKGSEIFVTTSEKSTTVEEKILKRLASVGFTNRGVKKKNFSVIAEVKRQGVSSALLEVCFIDDADDMKIFLNNKQSIAENIALAIAEGFNIETNTLDGACKLLFDAEIINSPDYWAKGKGYSDANTVLLIKKFAEYVRRKGK